MMMQHAAVARWLLYMWRPEHAHAAFHMCIYTQKGALISIPLVVSFIKSGLRHSHWPWRGRSSGCRYPDDQCLDAVQNVRTLFGTSEATTELEIGRLQAIYFMHMSPSNYETLCACNAVSVLRLQGSRSTRAGDDVTQLSQVRSRIRICIPAFEYYHGTLDDTPQF